VQLALVIFKGSELPFNGPEMSRALQRWLKEIAIAVDDEARALR
jgi:hypothetical protein